MARGDALSLQRETYDLWRAFVQRSWDVVDPGLLELCRRRIADPHGSVPAESELERAALDWVDQYVIDQNGITPEQNARLGELLAPRAVNDFAFAVYAHDADRRAHALVGDGGASEGGGEVELDPDAELFPLPVDPRFGELLGSFGNEAVRRLQVDEVTSELCRLRNAIHQQCHF